MSTNAKIITAIIVIVAIAIGAIIFFVIHQAPSTSPDNSGITSDAVSAPMSSTSVNLKIPEGDTIQLGGPNGTVTVNNFYKNVTKSEDEFLILAETSNYEITYDTVRNAFYIDISSSTPSARSIAEQAFLSLLGVSQSDACRLDVGENGPESNLSFCSGGAFHAP